MSDMPDEWDDVESGMDAVLWGPMQGEPRIGHFIRTETVTMPDSFNPGQTREGTVHYFRDPSDNTAFKIWGNFDLDSRVSQLKAGDLVRITYEGEQALDAGKRMKRYKVQRSKTGKLPGVGDDDIPF